MQNDPDAQDVTAKLDADLYQAYALHLPNRPNAQTVGELVAQVPDMLLKQRILDWFHMLAGG